MSSVKEQPSNKTMTFSEIISNIDTLTLKEEFIQIQTLMNEIFMNSSFIKETQQKKEIIYFIIFFNLIRIKNKKYTDIFTSVNFNR